MSGLVPLEEAVAHVLARVVPLPPVRGDWRALAGGVLAEPVMAAEAIPPFANTAMDGYAVQAADTVGAPVELRVAGMLAAGADPAGVRVEPGSAVRIMTGAAMPEGADAVVMVERTASAAGGATVRIDVTVEAGMHVRPAGDDIAVGDTVALPGDVLGPGLLGVLASLGVPEVVARRRPRVGVLSTGDELVDGAGPLGPGQIRDSNRVVLLALLEQAGCEAVDLGLVRDDHDLIRDAVLAGARSCDALLTSGGVSMGDIDLVRVVLDEVGEMRWMQIAIKPAKPFAFGVVEGTPVFGLPGNPVSSVVSFELLARPALRHMAGHRPDACHRPRVRAVADGPWRRRSDAKVHFDRAVGAFGADGRVHVRSAGGQGSHQLSALAVANALVVVPDGDGVDAGGELDAMLLW